MPMRQIQVPNSQTGIHCVYSRFFYCLFLYSAPMVSRGLITGRMEPPLILFGAGFPPGLLLIQTPISGQSRMRLTGEPPSADS